MSEQLVAPPHEVQQTEIEDNEIHIVVSVDRPAEADRKVTFEKVAANGDVSMSCDGDIKAPFGRSRIVFEQGGENFAEWVFEATVEERRIEFIDDNVNSSGKSEMFRYEFQIKPKDLPESEVLPWIDPVIENESGS